jgi:hypothetical protein
MRKEWHGTKKKLDKAIEADIFGLKLARKEVVARDNKYGWGKESQKIS